MSFKIEVLVSGTWSGNGLRFATAAEADANGIDLLSRWFIPETYRVVECDDPVNYAYIDGKLTNLEG